MIDRHHVQKILDINGISNDAEDDAIRSVLVSAKWKEDDVETALTVLREDRHTGETHVDTYKDIFTTDARLSPESIESLLGIQLDVTSNDLAAFKQSRQSVSFWQVMSIVAYATILAFSSILVVMYIQNFGLFHPGV